MEPVELAAVLAGAVLVASMISVEIGVSVALIELALGVALGNTFDLDPNASWPVFIASFASVVLTFLAGAEVDPDDFKERLGASMAIGGSRLDPRRLTAPRCCWPNPASRAANADASTLHLVLRERAGRARRMRKAGGGGRLRGQEPRSAPINGLVVSGLTELALGALTGWAMALSVTQPEDLGKIGIRSGARLRQWHLDLIMLGGLTAASSRLVPDPPPAVAVPLAIGAWTNANAFGVLAFRPELGEHPLYKAGVVASFASTSWGFTGLAAVAWRRWWRADARPPGRASLR
jgi:hypothetical protein